VAVVAVVAVGGVALYSTFLAGDSVPELGLDTPAPSVAAAPATPAPSAGATTPTGIPAASDPGSATAAPSPPAPGDLAGTWTVAEGVAGYRVRETFLQQNADTDAVGRTSGVTGSLTVEGTPGALALAAGQVEVDMTTLKSDRDRRDGQLVGRGIETASFPTSTFVLAGPVALPAGFGGADTAVTLPGTLTLHGITKDVEIAAQARVEPDGTVVVAGSLPVRFSDYGIEAPNVAGIIAVQDNGSMEFRVVLAKG
jgi:polyisoprenoid-binding protein YceI